MSFLIVLYMFFASFGVYASCAPMSCKRQKSVPRAKLACDQKKELFFLAAKENGDYDAFCSLINRYFDQSRLRAIEVELEALAREGEVRPKEIDFMERLGDAYRQLCQFENAVKWYCKAECEALTHSVMYQKDFGAHRLKQKLDHAIGVLALLQLHND